VSVLCHTLSGNAFGRALVIAELLARDFDVHIVTACGPNDELWRPAQGACPFEIRRWTAATYPGFLLRSPSLVRRLVTGDLIYSIKPRLTSLGLGLVARRVRGVPLIADVDDEETGFSTPLRDALLAPWALVSTASPSHTRWLTTRTQLADAVTVSSAALHARHGGTWVPHARDETLLHPASPAAKLCATPTVVFVGTPRAHKGLTDLVAGFRLCKVPARLRIVGGTLDRELVRRVAELADPRIVLEPPVSLAALREILAAAEVVAIPQQVSAVSRGQLPAKLLDALAMGKAIVSTQVGDIPRWLADDAGVVVPPSDPRALARALDDLLTDPVRRARLGERARRRFLELGSFSVVRPRLVALVAALLRGEPAPPSVPSFAL
jgi:glycosyltransferase involved in cell wall biosynthesis